MLFESLPAEIQIQIFIYLEGFQLKAVRLVCRAFRDNAEPTLFRSVIATSRYQSLGAFQKISLFPIFQKHVREIVFDGSLYDKTLAKHEKMYHVAAARSPDLEQGFGWHKHGRWKRYQQCFKEQEEMKIDGVLVQTISRALEWMPNVSCITYSPRPRHLPVEVKEMRGLLPRGVSTSHGTGYTNSDHPFRQLIAALYMSQFVGIREFRTEALNGEHGTEFSLSIFDLKEDSDMAAGKFLFQHLEILVLNLALHVPNVHLLGETLDKFTELLRASVNLQHIHLHPTNGRAEMGARPLFVRLGLLTTWPGLQSLSLKEVLADEEDFSGIINRHKGTLTSVKFSECSIVKGAWADVVDEVVYGSKIFPFVLDRVNERELPFLDYASLSVSERENWNYEGYVQIGKDGDRVFAEGNSAKHSAYDSRKQQPDLTQDSQQRESH